MRKSKGLGSTSVQHTSRVKADAQAAELEAHKAAEAIVDGACSVAIKHLSKANQSLGKATAHQESSTPTVSRLELIKVVDRLHRAEEHFGRVCLLPPRPALRGVRAPRKAPKAKRARVFRRKAR